MDKLFRIELVANEKATEPKFTAVVFGNGGPTDFKGFSGDDFGFIFDQVADYIEASAATTKV